MGNLFDLLRKYSHFILFLVLQLICFRMLYNGSPKHRKNIDGTSSSLVGSVFQKKKSLTDYLYLSEINDSLLKENTRLRAELMQQVVSIPIADSTGSITIEKDSIKKTLRYHYYAAKVLHNIFDEPNNYLTINRGAYHGIKKGMAVISNNGIVGQVVNTSPHFSVVKSIISKQFRVSAQLKSNIGYISWNDIDSRFVTLNDVSSSLVVKQGDSVYTSGFSLFPANILIGRLAKLMPGTDANNYLVSLSTNFRKLHYVYVVEDITEEEMTAVLDSAKAMDKPLKPNR